MFVNEASKKLFNIKATVELENDQQKLLQQSMLSKNIVKKMNEEEPDEQ